MLKQKYQMIATNGVVLRAVVEGEGPLCILVHGWPESWYSWRHQIEALTAAGYRVAVPDNRGYGGSDKPHEVDAYGMPELTGDIVGLIEALGEKSAILIGHDWGAPIVWNTSLLHPECVSAVVGLSVPHLGRTPIKPMELWRNLYKDRFFYQLYFQKEGVAEAELESDVRKSLRMIYYSYSGDYLQRADKVPLDKKPESRLLDTIFDTDVLPGWLKEEDLDFFTEEFERSGFRGSLNRYRCQDSDWERLPQLAVLKVKQPALFIAGALDPVLRFVRGVNIIDGMDFWYEDLRDKILIEGAGHWVQQERPVQTNDALLNFLRSIG